MANAGKNYCVQHPICDYYVPNTATVHSSHVIFPRTLQSWNYDHVVEGTERRVICLSNLFKVTDISKWWCWALKPCVLDSRPLFFLTTLLYLCTGCCGEETITGHSAILLIPINGSMTLALCLWLWMRQLRLKVAQVLSILLV